MSAFLGADPTDDDLRGICEWVLGGDVIYLCPEGLRAFAKGTKRLLDRADNQEETLLEMIREDMANAPPRLRTAHPPRVGAGDTPPT